MSADKDTRRLFDARNATGWFEYLYAEAADGRAEVPWDQPRPTANLASAGLPPGEGRPALVVGCGLGRDAEFLSELGYVTTAFDIAPTAVRVAQQRHPGSAVDYRVADLLAAPAEWRQAFALVVESNTVQALPRGLRRRAIAAVGDFVAPDGMLLVLAAADESTPADDTQTPGARTSAARAVDARRSGGSSGESRSPAAADRVRPAAEPSSRTMVADDGPPWPLTRDEIDAFATDELRLASVESLPAPGDPLGRRWRARFVRQ